jgi:uncharacterized membrane protein YqjE
VVTNDPGSGGGLFISLRRLLATVIEVAQVRLDLLSAELEIEKQRILAGLLFGVAALLVLGVGAVLACGFIILLLWDGYRLAAVGVLALIFFGSGLWLMRSARECLRSPGGLFAASVAELKRDQSGIAPHD